MLVFFKGRFPGYLPVLILIRPYLDTGTHMTTFDRRAGLQNLAYKGKGREGEDPGIPPFSFPFIFSPWLRFYLFYDYVMIISLTASKNSGSKGVVQYTLYRIYSLAVWPLSNIL